MTRSSALATATLSLGGVCLSLVVASCGPSVQSIYEGNVRFEHCYRLDLELEVAATHRHACWVNWLERYTYGQTRDRLEYARRRVRAGENARPSLNIGREQEAESRQFYLVVPAPTSVHSPPPPIATRVNVVAEPPPAPSGTPLAKSAEKLAPGEECAEACRNAFSSCNEACATNNGKGAACKSCDPDYKKCMQRCFE